ncbi:MAG: DUF3341 domain-containing protein [Candidatus Marinimicrobia bacterium]|jgi:hypothetical protein|nr:DUF3341 domain-containing protein [Candidatus Neomarinimicrobiota bacterium]MBT3675043.1 DUF3341 domain-containing protein [Candidatus Neomarinimicrobiota bacterium]MBT3762734.1 DUF3341 domain-containing protein [Candidatus Neomarinimicrobiota bacterium]MBT4068820.1 DUF3341 domain-containing protein [Candidatus Neomarinimicrobiota bacterium]MBT4271300.1 DUF3341 domain-containing protein [Candidatus Neomarinimicrobiota bacterium]
MDRQLIAEFRNEFDLTEAVQAVRDAGFEIVDAYTPFAVHGLDKAMGLKKSRLNQICFLFGSLGLAIGVLGQYWISAVNWPINIGGRPWNSLPAFMPVAFEVTILFAGLGTVFSFFAWRKVKYGKQGLQPHLRVTNDRFFVVMKQGQERKASSLVSEIVQQYHGEMVAE